MDFHLTLSCFAFVVSIATLAYAVHVNHQAKFPKPMKRVELTCAAWNNANPVGTIVVYEPEPNNPIVGRVAVRTLGSAYVSGGKAFVDVEKFKAVELQRVWTLI